MSADAYDIELCVDCVVAEGAGQSAADPGWSGFYEHWDSFAFAPHIDEQTDEPKEPHFGWSPCDGCGTGLGGDRFDYVAVEVKA